MHLLTLIPLLFALPSFAELLHTDFPHLLIPLVRSTPNRAYGTKNDATVSNGINTEVSFDVPANIANASTCRVNFHINTNAIKNAPKELKGYAPFQFYVSRLEPSIDKDADTWFSHPPVTGNGPVATITLGTDWSVKVEDGWFECPFGQLAQFLLHPIGTRSFSYYWFELNYGAKDGGPHGITLELHS